ncbi:hypothetical protein ACS0TY_005142 [Phlomoides rotata]
MESKNCREDEDEKMEKFFKLMNNYRNKLHQLQKNGSNKRKRTTSSGGWAPAFQLEDFTSEIEFKKHFPNPACNNDDKNPGDPTSSLFPPNLKLTL